MKLQKFNSLPLIISSKAHWTPLLLTHFYLNLTFDNVHFGLIRLFAASTSLNHWLAGSHVESPLKHLQSLVTTTCKFFEKSTSKQTLESSPIVDEMCILVSDIISHFVLRAVPVFPSFACFPACSACKQRFWPFNDIVCCGVYVQASDTWHGPNSNCRYFLRTQRPVIGWKITLYGSTFDLRGPACISTTSMCFGYNPQLLREIT